MLNADCIHYTQTAVEFSTVVRVLVRLYCTAGVFRKRTESAKGRVV